MQLHRVCSVIAGARKGEPGHPLHIAERQGGGRWDNPSLYRCMYLAEEAEGAIGETFFNQVVWSAACLRDPALPGSERMLVTYKYEPRGSAALDFDDSRVLVDLRLRPTDVVRRDRGRTQDLARRIFEETDLHGLRWWSMHWPDWGLLGLWDAGGLVVESVTSLRGNPSLAAAASTLRRVVDPDLH